MIEIFFQDGEWSHTEHFIGSLVGAIQYAKSIQQYICCSAEIKVLY